MCWNWVDVPMAAQRCAIDVCSGVRTVLVVPPSALTSLKSVA